MPRDGKRVRYELELRKSEGARIELATQQLTVTWGVSRQSSRCGEALKRLREANSKHYRKLRLRRLDLLNDHSARNDRLESLLGCKRLTWTHDNVGLDIEGAVSRSLLICTEGVVKSRVTDTCFFCTDPPGALWGPLRGA